MSAERFVHCEILGKDDLIILFNYLIVLSCYLPCDTTLTVIYYLTNLPCMIMQALK